MKTAAGKIWDFAGSDTAAHLSNVASDAAASAGLIKESSHVYPGERHAISLDGPTKGMRHAYSGPGTWYETRQKLGIQPINDVDRVSMGHDAAYARAGKQLAAGNPEAAKRTVREADLAAIKGWQNTRGDPKVATAAIASFRGMMLAQDAGKMDPLTFIDKVPGNDPADAPIQEGKGKPPLPGANLRKAVRRAAKRAEMRGEGKHNKTRHKMRMRGGWGIPIGQLVSQYDTRKTVAENDFGIKL